MRLGLPLGSTGRSRLGGATVLLLTAAPATFGQQPASPPPPLTLSQALDAAREHSPTILAARLRQPVDLAAVAIAREYPNPEARYEHAKDTPRDSFGLTQTIEVPDKRSWRIKAAEAAALTGRAEIAQVEAEVAFEVRRAYYALAAAQRRSAAIAELLDLVRRAREAAEARLEAGEVSQLDALQAQVAFAQAENEAAAQAGTTRGAVAELNALLGRDPAEPTIVDDEVDAGQPPELEAALRTTESTNAALAILDRQIEEAQARRELARAERWPDPAVEAALTHGAEPDFTWGYRFSLAVPLPLFTRHQANVQAEEATLALRRAEREAAVQRARAAVVSALARAQAQHQRYLRFRDEILLKNREVEQMAQEAYREGETPLSALLQALQASRDLRAQALDAASEYQSALAELEQAMTLGGKP
ncbi:MAG TPA: TolC family protein [Vicinamibacteria bacterium]|nr:TolC family protein [Vicinamibacteria bacterium]